jgi:hypothetical protein
MDQHASLGRTMARVPAQGKNGFIAKWGPVVGFVGGLVGALSLFVSLFDRFPPPSVEILDLIPLYISEPTTIMSAKSAVRGVGVLLHVRAGSRPISLTGLELIGKRCVSIDEFFGLIKIDGKTMDEMEVEFNHARPFQHVSFSGWPTSHSGLLSLAPWEENYFRFTFLEPDIGSSGLDVDDRFFGSVKRPNPMTRRYGFNVLEMFTLAPSERIGWTAGHLRNEILDGVLLFKVLASGRQISVPTDAVRPPKRLTPDVWKKENLAPLLAEQFPSLELRPTQNRSINCYTQPQSPSS